MKQNAVKNNPDLQKELALKKQRSIVLNIATQTGIHNPSDWSVFNSFMLNRSVLKKPLRKYDLEELDQLIKQFRALEENYNSSAKKVGTKAWNHTNSFPDLSRN